MPISVTCECGARLEIDEKFLGKEVLCPDCQRPLPTKAPPTPPPLNLPEYRRTSGLAVLSLTLSLVGAFVGGGIAGIVIGFLALKEIAAKPTKLEGVNLARAGIATGIVGTLLLLAALISPTVGGLDVFLRDLAMGGRLEYALREVIEDPDKQQFTINRPSGDWARYKSSFTTPNVPVDELILVNTSEDAYIACQYVFDVHFDDDDETKQKKALARFNKSELVNLIGRLRGAAHEDANVVESNVGADGFQEIIVDIRLGGIQRRAILRYNPKDQTKLTMLVGCARRSRFEHAEKVFRDNFASFKSKL